MCVRLQSLTAVTSNLTRYAPPQSTTNARRSKQG